MKVGGPYEYLFLTILLPHQKGLSPRQNGLWLGLTLTLILTLTVTDIKTLSGNSAPSRYWMFLRNYACNNPNLCVLLKEEEYIKTKFFFFPSTFITSIYRSLFIYEFRLQTNCRHSLEAINWHEAQHRTSNITSHKERETITTLSMWKPLILSHMMDIPCSIAGQPLIYGPHVFPERSVEKMASGYQK